MVGDFSSMVGLSAVAVDKEMVGKDSDAELIGGDAFELAPAGWGVACFIWASALDLGEDEKNWVRRLDLTDGALVAMPPFPEEGEKDGELEVSLEELLLNRRGIAEGSSESGGSRVGIDCRVLSPEVRGAFFLHASTPTIEAGATHEKAGAGS